MKSKLLNRIRAEIEKILRKTQNSFQRNPSTTSQTPIIRLIIEGVHSKDFKETLLFVDFSK